MNGLTGLAWMLAFQSLGELLARGLGLPLPGPVIGMVLLLPALGWVRVREPVSSCAQFLLSHLSLLFIPVGVGVMTHLSLLSQYGLRMLVVLVLSTLAGLAVTALTLHWLRPRPSAHALPPEQEAGPDA
ncbi:MAG: CidA/LrgA family protein [Pseudomonadota bacterium]|nr:CidA/LrgA family protein [Pseudomonadota bacterium]